VAGWLQRLVEAFVSFGSARNWSCKYHGGAHWQDEVVSECSERLGVCTSKWYLHGNLVAAHILLGGARLLVLTDAGYPTPTTLSRLNAALSAVLERFAPGAAMGVGLKYWNRIGEEPKPVRTFLDACGRTYVREKYYIAVVRGEAHLLNPCEGEVYFFMHYPRLRRLWRLSSEAGEHLRRAYEMLLSVRRGLPSDGSWLEVEERVGELLRWRGALLDLKEDLGEAIGLERWGVSACASHAAAAAVLRELARAAAALRREAESLYALARLVA